MSNLLRNRSTGATFLSFHSVAERGSKFLTISPSLFERQLRLLKRRGLRTGGLPELEAVAAGTAAPNQVFLTFDDGFVDNHTTVLPLLRAAGMRAFCFVVPPLVDTGAALAWPEVSADQQRYPEEMRSVTWPMVEEMAEGGFEIGSHTLSHAHLDGLDGERLREELLQSRRRIIDRLGRCDTLAYPFGDWNPAVAVAARDCGYRFAFTLPRRGRGQAGADALSIPRINIDLRDKERRFGLKLTPLGKHLILSPQAGPLRQRTHSLRSRF